MKGRIGILLFAAASAVPTVCLLAAAVAGGPWPLLAVLAITAGVLIMDTVQAPAPVDARLGDTWPVVMACAHFAILGPTVWAIGQPDQLDFGQKAALVVAMGLYAGQISNAVAHELIHRTSRPARLLGTALYCSLLNGQHVSAHLLLHHVHTGTAKDPCSAPVGRSYYRFALTAARAEVVEGWRAETRRRDGNARRLHPYAVYATGACLSAAAAWMLGGSAGLLALVIIALHAQSQLLLSDYVQHYGLRRRILPSGKPEPVGPRHSWNAPHACSGAMMLNAPWHSDHHMHPTRRFTQLELDTKEMPMLPYALPVMAAIALVPPLWRKVMDPQVRTWMPLLEPGSAATQTSPRHAPSLDKDNQVA